MKLWVDSLNCEGVGEGWILCNGHRAIQLLRAGAVTELNVSHDLGDCKGTEVLMYLAGMVEQGFRPIPKITLHELPGEERTRLLNIIEMIDSSRFTHE